MSFLCAQSQKKQLFPPNDNIDQSLTYQIETDEDKLGFTIIPAGKKGLAILVEVNRRRKDYWVVYYLDTLLQEQWRLETALPTGLDFVGYEHFENSFFILGKETAYGRKYSVLEIGLDSDTTLFWVDPPFHVDLIEFESVGRLLLFAGYTEGLPVVFTFNLSTNKINILPDYYRENREILKVIPNDEERTFTVILSDLMHNKSRDIQYRIYAEDGEELFRKTYRSEPDFSYQSCLITTVPNEAVYLSGTYQYKKQGEAGGIFVTSLTGQESRYDFGYQNNSFQYLKGSRKEIEDRRAQRRREKGKNYMPAFKTSLSEIYYEDGKIIVTAEAYFRKYTNYSTLNGGPQRSLFYGLDRYEVPTRLEFYQYSHSLVYCFDTIGGMLWDHSFKYEDMTRFNLSQLSFPALTSDSLVWMFVSSENDQETETLLSASVAFGDEQVHMRRDSIMISEESSLAKISGSKMNRWYDKTFYLSGRFKTKKNKKAKFYQGPEFFFITKISILEDISQ